MLETGATLGGEQSGHVIDLEHHTTGDGLATALMLLGVLDRLNVSMEEVVDLVRPFPQKLVAVPADRARAGGRRPDLAGGAGRRGEAWGGRPRGASRVGHRGRRSGHGRGRRCDRVRTAVRPSCRRRYRRNRRDSLMCGIVGYVGSRPCKELLLQGLERLEYRGLRLGRDLPHERPGRHRPPGRQGVGAARRGRASSPTRRRWGWRTRAGPPTAASRL